MSTIDWAVLLVSIGSIILYGLWKSRGIKTTQSYLLADRQLPWFHVGLSVMATQASAITFISAPGQAYSDGLQFLQFYLGLPLAMIVLCIAFIPAFHKLNVYTAYEYLENRFDLKTRALTAFLFLIQRGISTGLTIYAPAIILCAILGIDIELTIIINGLLVVIYTVYGGTKAVSHTQLAQMIIIFSGLFLAAFMVVKLLPENVGVVDALDVAGKMGRMNALDFNFDINSRYNIWSGLIAGFFLQLSYFGTDQSQVGRYLTGSSIAQSRLGLIMNGLVKIPMQFLIMLIGILVFSFYQFYQPPHYFNANELTKLEQSTYADSLKMLTAANDVLFVEKKEAVINYINANEAAKPEHEVRVKETFQAWDENQKRINGLVHLNNDKADKSDADYVFLRFITAHLPVGIVGLLMAIIFLASMGSAASGLNSLASTSTIDVYRRLIHNNTEMPNEVNVSRWLTVFWGLFCVIVAIFASRLSSLIEAVNILGSLFYGTILGIFLVAFFLKKIAANEVFIAAIITEVIVVAFWYFDAIAFLWLNVVGCLGVIMISKLLFIIRK